MDYILRVLDDFAETLWGAIKEMVRERLEDYIEWWEQE
jgi:hypothetical protein